MTRTYVLMRVSRACYDELARRCVEAGQDDRLKPSIQDPDNPRVMLDGIAAVPEDSPWVRGDR